MKVALAVVLPLLVALDAAAVDVASCGTTIAPNDVGMLTTDLSCAGPFGVELERGAVLDLNKGEQVSIAHAWRYGLGGTNARISMTGLTVSGVENTASVHCRYAYATARCSTAARRTF